MKDEENEEEGQNQDVEIEGDMQIKRRRIMYFKFWPKDLLQSAWKTYLSAGESGENLNAAYLAV